MSAEFYRKHFVPLESNPEVFTSLIHTLGVSPSLEFQDVLSLDDKDLLDFLPRPAYALILVFPTTDAYECRVTEEDRSLEPYEAGGDVLFFKQTINKACGLYAILHAVCNGDAVDQLSNVLIQTGLVRLADMLEAPNSTIDKIRQQASFLSVDECARVLEDNQDLEKAYAEVAQQGDTEAPSNPEDEVEFHYICFVKARDDGHLYQIDGDRKRSIDLGGMDVDEDVLSDKCLDVIRRMMASEGGNVNFSLMSLVAVTT
jgi:ubiquitin carboxyl-terminal hydrolase L3